MSKPGTLLRGGVQDWATFKQAAKDGYADAVHCLASIEIIERSNCPSLIDQINTIGAGRAASLIRYGLLFQLHMLVVRAFAPVRHSDDLHLRAAIGFLQHSRHIYCDLERKQFADLETAVGLFDAAQDDARLEPMKKMRDKHLAHWAMPDSNTPRTIYKDLFGFARLTSSIWERLAFGAGIISVEVDIQVRAYRKAADAFWSTWERSGN